MQGGLLYYLRMLFMEGILRMKVARPQYWVVDALDECKSDTELVPLLNRAHTPSIGGLIQMTWK